MHKHQEKICFSSISCCIALTKAGYIVAKIVSHNRLRLSSSGPQQGWPRLLYDFPIIYCTSMWIMAVIYYHAYTANLGSVVNSIKVLWLQRGKLSGSISLLSRHCTITQRRLPSYCETERVPRYGDGGHGGRGAARAFKMMLFGAVERVNSVQENGWNCLYSFLLLPPLSGVRFFWYLCRVWLLVQYPTDRQTWACRRAKKNIAKRVARAGRSELVCCSYPCLPRQCQPPVRSTSQSCLAQTLHLCKVHNKNVIAAKPQPR